VKHREARARRSREAKAREKAALLARKAAMVRGCEECGELIAPHRKMDTRFCSEACQRRVSHRRHRARNRNAFVETVDPLVVLERGDNVCGICGGDVDPGDFHIDHIVPLARGGLHNYENTQPAHPRCNWAKSAREDYVPAGVTGARY
jgi:5-methylcytosine-specific restriction endonuclease McrA